MAHIRGSFGCPVCAICEAGGGDIRMSLHPSSRCSFQGAPAHCVAAPLSPLPWRGMNTATNEGMPRHGVHLRPWPSSPVPRSAVSPPQRWDSTGKRGCGFRLLLCPSMPGQRSARPRSEMPLERSAALCEGCISLSNGEAFEVALPRHFFFQLVSTVDRLSAHSTLRTSLCRLRSRP